MMTKQNYTVFATLLATVHTTLPPGLDAHAVAVTLRAVTDGFVRVLASDNPRFDADRFRSAASGLAALRFICDGCGTHAADVVRRGNANGPVECDACYHAARHASTAAADRIR